MPTLPYGVVRVPYGLPWRPGNGTEPTGVTAAAVERIKPDPKRRLEIADALLTGLFLIVEPSGKKSWAVRYRYQGSSTKFTIGSFPTVGLVEARAAGRQVLQRVAEGQNPAAEKRAAKTTALISEKQPDTFRRIARLFVDEYCKRHRQTWRETERLLMNDVVPVWGERLFVNITRADVNELLRTIINAGMPYKANHAFAFVRKLFNWAIE